MVLILCSVLSIIKCIYIHGCFKIEFVSEFSYFIYVFNTKDYYKCLSLIEPCHEKSAFLKNKGADQPNGNYAAYQLLCLCYIDSTMSVLQKMKFLVSSHLENQSVNTRVGVIANWFFTLSMNTFTHLVCEDFFKQSNH